MWLNNTKGISNALFWSITLVIIILKDRPLSGSQKWNKQWPKRASLFHIWSRQLKPFWIQKRIVFIVKLLKRSVGVFNFCTNLIWPYLFALQLHFSIILPLFFYIDCTLYDLWWNYNDNRIVKLHQVVVNWNCTKVFFKFISQKDLIRYH